MRDVSCGHCTCQHKCIARCDEECWETIRKDEVENCIERVDRLMLNTICNPKLKETEKIDVYLQCIRDAKRVIRGKGVIKGEEDDNN